MAEKKPEVKKPVKMTYKGDTLDEKLGRARIATVLQNMLQRFGPDLTDIERGTLEYLMSDLLEPVSEETEKTE